MSLGEAVMPGSVRWFTRAGSHASRVAIKRIISQTNVNFDNFFEFVPNKNTRGHSL